MISYGKCTKAQYEALTPVQDRIYFITDTGEQFLNGLPYNGEDNKDYLCLTAETDGATVGLKYDATPSAYPIVWHSADRRTWTAFEWTGNATDVATLANAGDKVYLRAFNGGFGNTAAESTNLKFSMTGTIAASGNVMSLLHGDDFETRSEVPAFGFQNLFRGCASLVEPPEMPAIRLGVRAYYCMFYGCALRHCPELPARTLTQACYGSMFGGGHQQFAKAEIGASSFEADPDFPLSEMAPLNKMFKGCASLATVTAHFELWSTADIGTVATNWLQNTAATGVFKCPSTLDTTTRDASHVPAGWSVIYTDIEAGKTIPSATASDAGKVLTVNSSGNPEWDAAQGGGDVPDATDYLCFVAAQANSTVGLDKSGSPEVVNLEYSTDKINWSNYTWSDATGVTITLANVGDCVWFRGNNTTFGTAEYTSNYYKFVMSGKINGSGNIMSLLDKSCSKTTFTGESRLNNLFENCTALVTAPRLPATSLSNYCYYGMFSGCTSLIKAPELPATSLINSCYREMFNGCTALIYASDLPATSLSNYCYYEMFLGCTSLIKAPNIFAKAASNEACCKNMFMNCTSLIEATVPNLNLNSYKENTLWQMFYNCTSLKHLKVYFPNWNGYLAYFNWLNNVSATGVFECPSALDCSTRDANHVPAGWTIVRTDSPESITSPTTSSSSDTYEVSPNTASVPVVTVASALTLSATAIDSGSVAYAEVVLDIASGATVTAGTNLTLVDTITAGKRNVCVVRWSGGAAKLYVTIVEDLPSA